MRCALRLLYFRRRIGITRIDEQADRFGFRHELAKHPDALCADPVRKKRNAGEVSFRPLRLGTSPSLTGSPPSSNTTGMVRVAAFAASATTEPPPAAIRLTPRPARSA